MASLKRRWGRQLRHHLPATLGGRLKLLGAATLVLASLLVFALMSVQQQRLLRTERASALHAQAKLLASSSRLATSWRDHAEADQLVHALRANPVILGARIVLPDGSLLASSADPASFSAGFPSARKGSDMGHLSGAGKLLVWAPILDSGQLIGRLEISATLEDLEQLFHRSLLESAFIISLALLLSLGLMSRAMRHLLRPVYALHDLLRRLTHNPALSARAEPGGGREIAALGRGINELIDAMQERDVELGRYRDNLEQIVQERTRALASAMAETDRANRSKSAFLAHISHEIRTPMNAIIGLGNLLRRSSLNRRQRDQLDKLLVSSEALLGVINDLLDYSRIEAGKLRLESIPFHLPQLCEQAIQVVAPWAEEKGLELLLLSDDDIPSWLQGDPLRLRQILINLLGNAVKFTERGTVLLHLRLRSALNGDNDAALRLSVHDTGIGISAEQQRMLFKPFTQADDSVTRRFGGTGLGLSICAQLISLMGGRIQLESKPGHGAHFHVDLDLPVARGETPAPATPPFRHALVLSRNNQLCWVLHSILNQWQVAVSSFDDPVLACRALLDPTDRTATPIDLLIVDWQIGDDNGLEFVAPWLHQLGAAAPITMRPPPRLVLLLGNAQYGSFEVSSHAQLPDAVLVKPLLPGNLLRALREAASDARSGGQPPAVHHAPAHAAEDLAALRGHRILVVDDLPLNREVTRSFLLEAGIEVLEAADGEEALAQLATYPCSLVLMDIQMPVLDGLGATRRIRQGKIQRDIPIIAVTAHATAEDRQHSLAAGMNDYLTKPIEAARLYQLLQRWLPAHPSKLAALASASATRELPSACTGESEEFSTATPAVLRALGWPARLAGINSTRGLAYHLHKPQLYRRIVDEFARSYADLLEPLEAALDAGDQATALRWAHSLKSAAASIGACRLSELAAALEQSLRVQPAEKAATSELAMELGMLLDSLSCLPLKLELPADSADLNESTLALVGDILALLATADARALLKAGQLAAAVRGSGWQSQIETVRSLIDDIEYEAAQLELQNVYDEMQQSLS